MPALLKRVSTITEKGQVTIPKPVRDALGLGYGGRIVFSVDENRRVSIEREDDGEGEDPVIGSFLTFLAADMKARPDHLITLPDALLARIAQLSEGVTADPDEAIAGDVAL